MMAQTEFINPLFMTATGNGLLTDGQRATAKTTKNCWMPNRAERVSGNGYSAADAKEAL